jgi:bifunctional N-acetylglucosamine-1-phosphate-uridyltransferase/glucosamine-1-phosphate-acetyltransferase GlmU-like protein
MYCFKRSFIEKNISKIDYNSIANERYLTDIVAIAYQGKYKLDSVKIDTDKFWHGVNTDEQLEEAKQKMSKLHHPDHKNCSSNLN